MTEHIQTTQYCTWVELLKSRAAAQPDDCAYTFLAGTDDAEAHLTYRQLDERARAIAASLQEVVTPGERVALLLPAGLDYLAAFLGCLYAQAVAVPLYPPRPNRAASRLQNILADAQPRVLLTDQSNRLSTEGWPAELNVPSGPIWISTDAIDNGSGQRWREPAVDANTLAFLQYTSGSTAQPKGVMVNHGQLLHNAQMIKQAFDQPEGMTGVNWLPLYHDMGLIGTLQTAYLGGRCVVMAPGSFLMQPLRWLHAVSCYRIHTSGGPNFAYELCARKISPEQCAGLDLSHWQVAFTGAEPVRPATIERFAKTFASCGFRREAFYPCYGLAEATLFVSGRQRSKPFRVVAVGSQDLDRIQVALIGEHDSDARTLVSCGQAWGDQQIEIVDSQSHRRCNPGTVGEVWISGSSVASGYWNRSEETNEVFRAVLDGDNSRVFLRTGDLGLMLDGELYLTGRLKDLLILGGQNHYAEDIELTVEQSHIAIRSGGCAAISVDVDEAERLVIVAEIDRSYYADRRQLSPETADDITRSVTSAIMQRHDLAVHDVLLLCQASIPKTTSGKIRRHACRDGYLKETLHVIGSDHAIRRSRATIRSVAN